MSTSILTLPSGTGGFTIYCDISKEGLGSVFMQDDKVAFASRQLKSHEKHYPTYDMKLTMIVFDLKIQWHYLYGKKCEVFTNHKNLKYIFTKKKLNMSSRDG